MKRIYLIARRSETSMLFARAGERSEASYEGRRRAECLEGDGCRPVSLDT
jgi:hypothetical protein